MHAGALARCQPAVCREGSRGLEAARLLNDCYAELVAPTQVVSWLGLAPPAYIDASLREMERGLDRLGMLGVAMTCSCFE